MTLAGTTLDQPIRLRRRFQDGADADRFRRLEISPCREDPDNMTTIMPVHEHVSPPEPERIRESLENEMAQRSREISMEHQREVWSAQRGTIAEAISVLREAGVRDPALWMIERRMAKLDFKFLA